MVVPDVHCFATVSGVDIVGGNSRSSIRPSVVHRCPSVASSIRLDTINDDHNHRLRSSHQQLSPRNLELWIFH